MGLILQPTSSQYRPPWPDTNPNVRKDKVIGKRKRTAPTKRFRPNTASRPSETAVCPLTTIFKAPINAKPQADVSEYRPPPSERYLSSQKYSMAQCRKDVRKPLQGKKGLVLPPNYLNNGNKDTAGVISPKPP